MKKRLLLSVGTTAIILIACAWYFRASIYTKLGDARVYQPSDFAEFTLGTSKKSHITYVALGDSLTAGVGVDTYTESYPYVLAKMIAGTSSTVTLKPFAIPGVRSAYILSDFIEPTIVLKPDIITLFIGINDIHGNVSLKQFKIQYAEILDRLTKETNARVYAINLPYIGTNSLIVLPYQHYFNWRTQKYNEIIEELTTQYGVTYIDLYTSHEPYALDNAYYAIDYFHPNAVGYALWAQYIYAHLRQ